MKVSELAEELGVPTSAVLEQCQRFGIDAGWAGADLKGTDVVVLRAELASAGEPLDLRPADEGTEAPAGAADEFPDIAVPHPAVPEGEALTGAGRGAAGPPAPLPPTAVGSMPDLIDEVTPDPDPAPHGGLRTAGPGAPPVIDDDGQRRIPPREAPAVKAFDRAARNSVGWLLAGVVAFVVSNVFGDPWLVAGLWAFTAFALAVALYDGNRGRRAILTHADRRRGLPVAIATSVLAVLGLVGMALLVVVTVRDEPAADAPLGVGELPSVDAARWGYVRLTRIIDSGWKTPAKDPGTCWEDDEERDPRDPMRDEVGNVLRGCRNDHTVEIARVFAMNRDADAPYPTIEGFAVAVDEECRGLLEEAQAAAEGQPVRLRPEIPTAEGWRDGDRDVACALVTPIRAGALLEG